MQYSELKAKATQGDWYKRNLGMQDGYVHTEICYGKDDECITDGVYEDADAALIVHQHNHFDKLLDALEGLSQKMGVLLTDLAIRGGNVKESYVAKAGGANFDAMQAIEAAKTVKDISWIS